ncbi:MAG: 1-phosphofructokinase family hexose kinase [Hyphomicrobium sp.]|uniref:1-phosphofructokinase family hexose kinase n=1 Tax=Hyphomicrobium sp. TaxID=82 RepID=UPI00132CBDE5|nr:1-phosphofructokinase family hexose kinase [Hyphomicrobium sp.]KAB2939575.1 MAG: 1-phosphofructokinase family hexose kinase [Hyphomicrobium sp.]MBZ0209275.1 1-phosphofructokinase family hexose kinase [Hyphomicrobium sp.]
MARILTLTLSPAIDVSTSVEHLVPVHKLRCGPVRRDPGGGGVNVARVIHRLGGDVAAVYPAGGLTGALLHKLADAEGVRSHAVPIAEETREDFTVVEEASRQEYRFVLPAPQLSEGEWRACLGAVVGAEERPEFIVASGSLPPGVPADFFRVLAKTAKERGTKLVLDSTKPALMAALEEGIHLIKPNLREFRELTDEPLMSRREWIDAARRLIATQGVAHIALTLGDRGALLITREEAWFGEGLSVKAVSSVGAGDSFLGAMVWALSAGHSLPDALRYGIAAGSAAVLAPGTSLCSAHDVKRLLQEVEVEQA